jgi:hypothetical protein
VGQAEVGQVVLEELDQVEVEEVALQTPAFSSGQRKSQKLLRPRALPDYGAISGFHWVGFPDLACNHLHEARSVD